MVESEMVSNRKKIVIIGAGGTGIQISDSIKRSDKYQLVGFLDDMQSYKNKAYDDIPVIGNLKEWDKLPIEVNFINSLYGPTKNSDFYNIVSSMGIPDYRWATICDPSSVISISACIACGVYIGPNCVVQAFSEIGKLSCILGNTYIAHHDVIENYVVCANSVAIGGNVIIKKGAYLGMNCCIRESLKIGTFATIGMGSVVIKDIPDYVIVAGNPANPIRNTTRK